MDLKDICRKVEAIAPINLVITGFPEIVSKFMAKI
jgi:hypothetical protein